MIFDEYEGYDKPKIKKINQYVYMAIYKGKRKKTIITLANNKGEELQKINLFDTTLKKIFNKMD